MKYLKKFTILTGVLLFTFSCSNSSEDDLTTPVDPNKKITYNADIKPIISNNCLNCHGTPLQNGAPESYETYDAVKTHIDHILGRINNADAPMPTSGLMSQTNRDKIQKWKDDGLLEN